MNAFEYVVADSATSAREAVAARDDAEFFAGGTTLVDLMKAGVMRPGRLVDITRLPLAEIAVREGVVAIGALARNSDVADDRQVKRLLPALSLALDAGASGQLRNMATVGGNLLQRTRCVYYRDTQFKCNRREPGSGCDAIGGFTRTHAVLGTSEHCIASHPSDMAVALTALEAIVVIEGPNGTRRVTIENLYRQPGATPEIEHDLDRGELIVGIDVPTGAPAASSTYVKLRDRASYEFALVSAAAALELRDGAIVAARLALGGVGTVPWRSREAEAALVGLPAEAESFARAAEVAMSGARTTPDNRFKVELARRAIVRAFETVTRGFTR